MDGDFDPLIVIQFHADSRSVDLGVAPQGSEEIAHPALAGIVAVLKAKALHIVRIAWVPQVAQSLGTGPAVDQLPADKQEH